MHSSIGFYLNTYSIFYKIPSIIYNNYTYLIMIIYKLLHYL